MFLESLVLKNFRSFKEVQVTFSPELNFIEGDNAEGKTNLLEAILFLSTGRSFRTSHLKELIHHGASFFYLEAHFRKEGLVHSIKAHFDGTVRRLQINEDRFTSFNPLLGMLPTILYAPDHVTLITGGPAERRRFLDLHLSQLDSNYLYHLSRYTGAMKQRNALLKEASEVGIGCWEEMMADSSHYLVNKRREAIESLKQPMQEILRQLSQNRDQLEIDYHSSFREGSSFLAQLQAQRPKELSYGSSLIGPHRDEFMIALNGHPARYYASEGQKRSILAALRFGQWHRVYDKIAHPPILSIDDFGAHLDKQRRILLQQQMANRGQVFLTAPHFEQEAFASLEKKTLIVKGGAIN